MDTRQMALEKVSHPIHIRFSYPPFPNADLRTIEVDLPEGALLLDAIRQVCIEHHIPVYLEHSLLSTAESVIHSTRRSFVSEETRKANEILFSSHKNKSAHPDNKTDRDTTPKEDTEDLDDELLQLQQAMIQNYRSHTSQFHTQPEENLFPEAYHTLIHSPIPSLFDAILDLERDYAGEVDALLSARDAEINDIQASQLDDLQTFQRSKYQEFILELYAIYKRREINLPGSKGKGPAASETTENGPLDGKDMVAEAMKTIGGRRSNMVGTPPPRVPPKAVEAEADKDLPPAPSASQSELTPVPAPAPPPPVVQPVAVEEAPPPPPPPKEDVELNNMIKSILEMGFDVEQAKGALLIANRNMDHAVNLLLEQPENIPRLVLAKQKVDAMKENARQKARAQSSPQPPQQLPQQSSAPTVIHPSMANNATPAQVNPALAQPQAERPLNRSASVSSPRPHIPGVTQSGPGTPVQKPWSPLPFFQQQKNALLTNNTNPSVKKFGGWLNKAIENLGLDDDFDHSKVTHNLKLMVSDPALVFPTHRVKSERDDAIHAQTASSLYGHNLTGLVQLVNIQDWAKYKSGQVCHQEFFEACQTSTELHFDTVEKQLEAMEEEMPLDGSTIQEGDFILTRHSNLPMIHVVFHLFYGQAAPIASSEDESITTIATQQAPTFSQSSDFVPKPDFLTGLRNILRAAHRYDITMLSLPFLMMPESFENLLGLQSVSTLPTRGGQHQHHPSGSQSNSRNSYGSPTMNAASTSSATSSPSVSSLSSFSTASSQHQQQLLLQQQQQPQQQQQQQQQQQGPISDQARKDLHRRAETLLRHLKSFLMDNARQVKQVGNQGSEAEKFRASQGGDVKVVQFLLPKQTSDDMFRNYRALLLNVFGGA
ncbi:hypothetical protein BGZ83_005299 [Gryganskiella cystojenkinii]|nr:hypothetical protein BGZ83_005299 [Gryganskiella cystojenkinii]